MTVESNTIGIERHWVRSNTQEVLRIWVVQCMTSDFFLPHTKKEFHSHANDFQLMIREQACAIPISPFLSQHCEKILHLRRAIKQGNVEMPEKCKCRGDIMLPY